MSIFFTVFGLDKRRFSENIYLAPGESKNIQFKLTTAVKPSADILFYIKYNEVIFKCFMVRQNCIFVKTTIV